MSGINVRRAKGGATEPDLRLLKYIRNLALDAGNVRGWAIAREVGEPDTIVVTLLADCDEVDRIMSGISYTAVDVGPRVIDVEGQPGDRYDPQIGHVVSGGPSAFCRCEYGDRGLVAFDSRCKAAREAAGAAE